MRIFDGVRLLCRAFARVLPEYEKRNLREWRDWGTLRDHVGPLSTTITGPDAFNFAVRLFSGAAGLCPFGSDNLDSDGDGVADARDLCPNTTPPGVCRCAPGEHCCRDGCLIGDVDGDGVRDLSDFRALQNCFSGSAGDFDFSVPDAGLGRAFDVDEDTDIDLSDFAFFRGAMGAP
jgi:hypothetical protein